MTALRHIWRSAHWRKSWLLSIGWLAAIGLASCGQPRSAPRTAAKPAEPPKISLGSTFCLTTQWYPDASDNGSETERRLLRELVRQGVLIAAREELGLVTRDETLEEPFGAANADGSDKAKETAVPMVVQLETYDAGPWKAILYGGGATIDNPVWQGEGSLEVDNKRVLYAEFAKRMTGAMGEIAERLRAAGATGKALKLNPDNRPPEEIEKQLLSMNFVSQFAAVRAAHRAMGARGPSLEWMGVLVRGYGNLATLTEHTWSSQTEAFAARSLLYAERMCRLGDDSELALWHRAYARALVGIDGAAIDQLDELAKAGESKAGAPPTWTLVIGPYVRFEGDKLRRLAKDHPELSETVALLNWNQDYSYMHGRWIYDKGIATVQVCPEAYGVYSTMANWNSLGISRTGAETGPAAFGELLPKRMAGLKETPVPGSKAKSLTGDVIARFFGGGEENPTLSDRPIKIAWALQAATATEQTPSECSWAILAGLIAEEQFVEAADMVFVDKDATEHSNDELLRQLAPLVEGHRYAAYIRSFGIPATEPQKAAELMSGLRIQDARASMKPLFDRNWTTSFADGLNGDNLRWKAFWEHDFTRPSLLRAMYGLAQGWTAAIKPEMQQVVAEEIRETTPNSPNALRLQWESHPGLTAADLSKLEAQLKEDPVGWMSIGDYYYSLKDLDSSERCYKRSLAISPSYNSTVGLANSYYYKNRKELWESTLESYLQVEDLGLAHGKIHQQLAQQFIRDRAWSKARPHAVAAAETYSAWGLDLASEACEGLQDWKASEEYAAECSRSYPSYPSGSGWYFWCRRNGRGDLAAARAIAGPSVEIAAQQTNAYEAYRAFEYRYLEGDKAGALAGLETQLATCTYSEPEWETMWRLLYVISVSNEVKDSARRDQAIAELKAHLEAKIKPTHPNWDEVVQGLCRGYAGEPFAEDFFTKCDQVYAGAAADYRCNVCYFLGVALDQQGLTKKADYYLRRAAFGGPFQLITATFAGSRLAERHGPDRGGIPEEFAPMEEQAAATASAETKESAAEAKGRDVESQNSVEKKEGAAAGQEK